MGYGGRYAYKTKQESYMCLSSLSRNLYILEALNEKVERRMLFCNPSSNNHYCFLLPVG